MPISEITQTEIRNILAPICHTKAGAVNTALMRLKLWFKHGRWAWMLILQAVEKARALLRRDSVVLLGFIKRKGSIL